MLVIWINWYNIKSFKMLNKQNFVSKFSILPTVIGLTYDPLPFPLLLALRSQSHDQLSRRRRLLNHQALPPCPWWAVCSNGLLSLPCLWPCRVLLLQQACHLLHPCHVQLGTWLFSGQYFVLGSSLQTHHGGQERVYSFLLSPSL